MLEGDGESQSLVEGSCAGRVVALRLQPDFGVIAAGQDAEVVPEQARCDATALKRNVDLNVVYLHKRAARRAAATYPTIRWLLWAIGKRLRSVLDSQFS